MQATLFIDASQPQHVPAGNLLGKMYYGGFLCNTLSRDEYSGYPHNGGEHTLCLKLAPADLGSFLSLVQERYSSHEGAKDFVDHVKAQVAKKYPRVTLQ